ncbi:unnamed protein product [Prorocentrum cordatum]|uniref:Uncharacterized protein n=1 Tax=Prorocentrum cordatum TaxID=2364126 RepID=A0ABN9V9N9_9DINO|nr:unnamed protein product [Polarella glacialis]
MHKIKDVTADTVYRTRDLPAKYYTKIAPRKALQKERFQQTLNEMQLKAFKNFLKKQFEDEGAEATERLELDQLVQQAELARQIKVRNEGKGMRIQKAPPQYYPGTRIEVQPIRGGSSTDTVGIPRSR